jgi:hypothetical protein
LAQKLLAGDPITNQLLAWDQGNPFYNGTTTSSIQQKPTFVRAVLYEYEYPGLTPEIQEQERKEGWEVGRWWKRRYKQEYFPPIEFNNPTVLQFLKAHNMINS